MKKDHTNIKNVNLINYSIYPIIATNDIAITYLNKQFIQNIIKYTKSINFKKINFKFNYIIYIYPNKKYTNFYIKYYNNFSIDLKYLILSKDYSFLYIFTQDNNIYDYIDQYNLSILYEQYIFNYTLRGQLKSYEIHEKKEKIWCRLIYDINEKQYLNIFLDYKNIHEFVLYPHLLLQENILDQLKKIYNKIKNYSYDYKQLFIKYIHKPIYTGIYSSDNEIPHSRFNSLYLFAPIKLISKDMKLSDIYYPETFNNFLQTILLLYNIHLFKKTKTNILVREYYYISQIEFIYKYHPSLQKITLKLTNYISPHLKNLYQKDEITVKDIMNDEIYDLKYIKKLINKNPLNENNESEAFFNELINRSNYYIEDNII